MITESPCDQHIDRGIKTYAILKYWNTVYINILDDPFVSDVNSVFNWDVAEKRKAMCTEQRLYANAFTIEELGKEDQANFYMVSGTLPYILMMLSDVSTDEACHLTAINGETILVPGHVAISLKPIRRSGTRRWNLRVPYLQLSFSHMIYR